MIRTLCTPLYAFSHVGYIIFHVYFSVFMFTKTLIRVFPMFCVVTWHITFYNTEKTAK